MTTPDHEFYIYVDVCDGDVIHVYPNDDASGAEGRDFIWRKEMRERRSDVLCTSRNDALAKARKYAAEQAKAIGCDWGENS